MSRELKEELGFELRERPLLLYTWTYTKLDVQRVYIVYMVNLGHEENFVSLEFSDALEFVWLDEASVRAEGLFPGLAGALLQALSVCV